MYCCASEGPGAQRVRVGDGDLVDMTVAVFSG